jgi:uncharacterized low-complexity protein
MRYIKLGLALVAALVFSVTMAASAFAALSFLSSVSKAKLSSTGVQTQVFKTNAFEMQCSEAKIEAGETAAAGVEATVQLAEVHYSKCLVFGFIPTTFTNFDYLFLPSGTVHLDNTVTLVASGCELKWPPQLVGTVKYVNSGNNIKLEPNISSILYTAKSCPSGNGEAKNGTLTGNSEWTISGGKLSFMP